MKKLRFVPQMWNFEDGDYADLGGKNLHAVQGGMPLRMPRVASSMDQRNSFRQILGPDACHKFLRRLWIT
jgi:hypothetical protein